MSNRKTKPVDLSINPFTIAAQLSTTANNIDDESSTTSEEENNPPPTTLTMPILSTASTTPTMLITPAIFTSTVSTIPLALTMFPESTSLVSATSMVPITPVQLKTPVNDDDISEISSSEDDTKSVEKNDTTSGLALLYNKANRNKEYAMHTNQAKILSWYHYAEGFEKQVKKILNNIRITTNKAKLKVYRELLTHLVDVDLQTLQKRTQRANT
ncbi:3909_t:CDS:2, partial [Racocetra fulgida]